MIGDDDGGMAGAAHGALDETDAVMRTGGIDAFAAPVGDFAQRQRSGQECRKARPGHVAVGVRADPARDQAQGHAALARRQRGSFRGFFEIEQAEIIFPPLAHHRLFGALNRIGIEMGDLLNQLALQIAGIGRNPKSGPVLFRPQAGRGEITQRLAGAGACFHQRDFGSTALFARPEGITGGLAISRLFGARRGHQREQTSLDVVRAHRLRAGCARQCLIFPLRQPAPGLQTGDGRAERCLLTQNLLQRQAPAPAGAGHGCHQGRNPVLEFGRPVAGFREQGACHRKQRGRGFLRCAGEVQIQSSRQAQRAGHQGQAGAYKNEQLQNIIERFDGGGLEPSGDKTGMGHQRLAGLENLLCRGPADPSALAVRAADGGAGRCGHKRGER